MDAPLRPLVFAQRRSPAHYYRRLAPVTRIAGYLAGCVLASVFWCALLYAVFRPGLDVFGAPDRYPLVQNLYLGGTSLILLGGAARTWRRWQGESWRALGLAWDPWSWRDVALGIGLGAGSLACLFAAEVAGGLLSWNAAAWQGTSPWLLLGNVFTAIFFGLSEEVLFRGFILQTLRRGLELPWAFVGSAWLYAVVHFMRLDLHWQDVAAPFVGLFLAGLMLAWLACRTRAIWFGAGLHTAWVYLFILADRQKLLTYPPETNWLTGGGYPLGGLLGVGMLGVLWLTVALTIAWIRRRPGIDRSGPC